MIHPARINETLNDAVITGKATDTDVPLMADRISVMLTVEKTRYLDIQVASGVCSGRFAPI
jgi:hypothetical protein